jgi:hypothetical protein
VSIQGDRGQRREHVQHRDPCGREDASSEVVLEVEQRHEPALLEEGKAEDGAGMLPPDVLVVAERAGR